MENSPAPRLYIAAAEKDMAALGRLRQVLRPVERAGEVVVWDRTQLMPGERVLERLADERAKADILVALLSPDFMNDCIQEIPELLRQLKRGAQVIPILVRPMLYEATGFSALTPLPADRRAISGLRDADSAWMEIARVLRDAVHGISRNRTVVGKAESVIKVLFLAANPSNTSRLELAKEVREIQERLKTAAHSDRFSLLQQWAVTPAELSQVLLRHRPEVVHFSGHGAKSGELLLLDQNGAAAPVPRAALAKLFGLFRTKGLRCVVLNACYAEEQARAIAEHIECVVGISGIINDSGAIAFSAGFYTALGDGLSVQEAFDFGCVQIELLGLTYAKAPCLFWRADVDPTQTRLI